MRLVLQLARWFPGAIGLLFRQKLYPYFFKECGNDVLFGRFITIKGFENISLGNCVIINDYSVLDAGKISGKTPSIRLDNNVFIGAGTKLQASGEKILIEKNSNIGSECLIISDNEVLIESNVLLAAYCRVGGTDDPHQKSQKTKTIIGSGCWLGVRSIIQSGMTVGKASIIGAHGVVSENIEPMIVAVGNPAHTLYSRKSE